MTDEPSRPRPCPLPQLAEAMQAAVQWVSAAVGADRLDGILRATVPIKPVSPLDWMAGPGTALRFYGATRDRAQSLEIGGVGVADEARWAEPVAYREVFDRLQSTLTRSSRGVRYYGGFRFDGGRHPDTDWRVFGFSRFVVPRFEMITAPAGSLLSLHFRQEEVRNGAVQRFVSDLAGMPFGVRAWDDRFPPPVARRDKPDFEGWRARVEDALHCFDKGTLQKVVLARQADFEFEDALDPVTLLHRLKTATPECYHFCYMPTPAVAFVGASPERLYKRENGTLETEAVAGTRMRSADPEEDERLGQALRNSDKDRREHAFVREAITAGLEPLCDDLEIQPTPSLLKLARGQHLYSPVKGRLKSGMGDADILEALHPTPALGGTPTAEALARIAEWEPFDRGWYAAPIGWVSSDAAEFAVAIRCGLVYPRRLALFSGAGLVAGSTPENEWEEIELKIRDFINVLTTS